MFQFKNYFEKFTRERKKVYIIPSKNGMRFVAINFFLFLISISYSNNLALLITFFMVTFFILQMFTIHRIINMIDLDQIVLGNEFINFEHYARVTTKGHNSKELCPYIQCSLMSEDQDDIEGVFHRQITPEQMIFKMNFNKRGRYQFKRIKFYTYGPTGLFYVWRYFSLNHTVYIYPQKITVDKKNHVLDQGERTNSGEAEFEYYTRYLTGMNSKRIDWKVYARTDQLYSKKFSDNEATVLDINFNHFHADKEMRLSYMSYLIDRYYHESIPYKVTLPNKILSANTGHRHYEESLEAISDY